MGNSMEDRKDVTVPMPASLVDAVEGQLGYGDSRAGWIRDAVEQRLEREGIEIKTEDETECSEGNVNKATSIS